MKQLANKEFQNILFTFILITVVLYVCYVISTSTHTPGCTESYQKCISSHKEISHKYWGRRWHDEEYEVCDEWETVTYDSECVTYHWFWGDKTRGNKLN
jgi:hypothetical protein